MAQRVFVNVVGFSDEERHQLNVLFRISEEREVAFSVWEPGAPEAARLALVDSHSYEARIELESPRNADIPVIWVGDDPPARAWRAFPRPIAWPDVVQAMDELFPAPAGEMDFDLDLGGGGDELDTQPPDTLPPDMPPRRRVLIAAPTIEERLYLRAKLSLADLTQADDAQTAAEALELARDNDYVLAIVDFNLPGAEGWKFVRQLAGGQRPIAKVIVTAARAPLLHRLRAVFAPVAGFFEKPPHPGKLHEVLLRV
jgi:CheY-like chemotaxis protein